MFCDSLSPLMSGVSNLIQQVCRLNKGLRLLNLSKTSLSSKGKKTPVRYSAPWWQPYTIAHIVPGVAEKKKEQPTQCWSSLEWKSLLTSREPESLNPLRPAVLPCCHFSFFYTSRPRLFPNSHWTINQVRITSSRSYFFFPFTNPILEWFQCPTSVAFIPDSVTIHSYYCRVGRITVSHTHTSTRTQFILSGHF